MVNGKKLLNVSRSGKFFLPLQPKHQEQCKSAPTEHDSHGGKDTMWKNFY